MFEWLIHSMKAIYNSRITEEENIQISADNRGFCYGDGLFETIVTGPHRINLIQWHLDRIERHMQLLSIRLPKQTLKDLPDKIEQLTKENQIEGNCRTKVMIWRKSGGLYSPESDEGELLITQKKTDKQLIRQGLRIGLCESARNHYSLYSGIKSLSALEYVMAGQEMKNKKFDEIIILDQKGNLSETHIGNLFWLKDGKLFTPSVSTGCIEGVMRNFIIDFYYNLGTPIELVEVNVGALEGAASIFSSNASGITYYERFKHTLKDPSPYLEPLIKRLQQP